MESIATKFVKHDVRPLDALANSAVYQMKATLMAGAPLTRDAKNLLFKMIYEQHEGGFGYKLYGWFFSFLPYLKLFWVDVKYFGVQKIYAPDKTAIRAHLGHKVIKIIEVK